MLRVVREYALGELAANGRTRTDRACTRCTLPRNGRGGSSLPVDSTARKLAGASRKEPGRHRGGVHRDVGRWRCRGAWRLAAALGPFIFLRGPYGQALRLIAEAGISATAELPDGVSELTAGVALQSGGAATFLTGDFGAALPPLRRSVELLIASGHNGNWHGRRPISVSPASAPETHRRWSISPPPGSQARSWATCRRSRSPRPFRLRWPRRSVTLREPESCSRSPRLAAGRPTIDGCSVSTLIVSGSLAIVTGRHRPRPRDH
jgi:hypothetical protein